MEIVSAIAAGQSNRQIADRLSISLHELFYGESSDYDNEGGVGYFKNTVDAAAITNLEVLFDATESLSLAVGATNLTDETPNKRNADHRAIQVANGDNSAVAQYPSFSPYGINGAYYYGKVTFKF